MVTSAYFLCVFTIQFSVWPTNPNNKGEQLLEFLKTNDRIGGNPIFIKNRREVLDLTLCSDKIGSRLEGGSARNTATSNVRR